MTDGDYDQTSFDAGREYGLAEGDMNCGLRNGLYDVPARLLPYLEDLARSRAYLLVVEDEREGRLTVRLTRGQRERHEL